MTDIFISYSRKDIAFAHLLNRSLNASGLDTWIDWNNIPVGENWWNEIQQAIEKSNVFMFIISKHSVDSEVCSHEINVALKNNKRIIPIVVDNLSPDIVNKFVPDLSKINWIIFEKDNHFEVAGSTPREKGTEENEKLAIPKDPQFQQTLAKLNDAIHKDWEWVKYHTQLQNDALRWQKNNASTSYLLRGTALNEAEKNIFVTQHIDPTPTELQTQYIRASQKGAQKRKRTLTLSISIGTTLLIILGLIGFFAIRISSFRKLIFESSSKASTNPGLSLLLAIEAQNMSDFPGTITQKNTYAYEAHNNLLNVLEANPRLISYLPQDSSQVIGAAFRPDGKVMATGNYTGEIRFWNVSDPFNPVEIGEPVNAGDIVTGVTFSADGKTLFSSEYNGTIHIWDVSDPKTAYQLNVLSPQNLGEIAALALSPDGRILAAAGKSGIVGIWDVSSPSSKDLAEISLTSTQKQIRGLAFSPDGKILAVPNFEKTIDLWSFSDPSAPQLIKTLSTGNAFPTSATFNQDGNILAVGNYNGNITIFDVKNPSAPMLITTLTGQSNVIHSVSFNPAGNLLASASEDYSVKVWNLEDLQNITDVDSSFNGHSDLVNQVVFSPDGNILASAGGDSKVALWNTSSTVNSPLMNSILDNSLGAVKSLSFSPDGSLLASGSVDVNLWSVDKEKQYTLVNTLSYLNSASMSSVTSFAFAPDGETLALGVADIQDTQSNRLITINISDPANPKQLAEIQTPHKDKIWTLAFTADGKTLISGSLDRSVRFWDIADAAAPVEIGKPIEGISSEVYSLAVSQQKHLLAVGISDGNIYFYDISSLDRTTQIGQPQNASGMVLSLSFSEDGNLLASGGKNAAYLWNTSDPAKIGSVFSQITGSSLNNTVVAAISPDGKNLAVGSEDSSLSLWDISNPTNPRQLGQSLTNQGIRIWSLAFSTNGNDLASGYDDFSAITWHTDTKWLIGRACQIAHRNLTDKEWKKYFPLQPYRHTCSSFNSVTKITDSTFASASSTINSTPAATKSPTLKATPTPKNQITSGKLEFGTLDDVANASINDFLDGLIANQHSENERVLAGQTITYNLKLEGNKPLIWNPKWCATDMDKLEDNLKHMTITEYANGQIVDLSNIFSSKLSYGSVACYYDYISIKKWPKGTSTLTTIITIKEPFDDGTYGYVAGMIKYEINVTN